MNENQHISERPSWSHHMRPISICLPRSTTNPNVSSTKCSSIYKHLDELCAESSTWHNRRHSGDPTVHSLLAEKTTKKRGTRLKFEGFCIAMVLQLCIYIYSVKESMAATSPEAVAERKWIPPGSELDTTFEWPIWFALFGDSIHACYIEVVFTLTSCPEATWSRLDEKARAKSKDENVYLTEYVESSIIRKDRLGRYTCRQYAIR